MATEEIGTYMMVAGLALMLVIGIKVLGIRRLVGLFVVLVLLALALGLKSLGAIKSARRD